MTCSQTSFPSKRLLLPTVQVAAICWHRRLVVSMVVCPSTSRVAHAHGSKISSLLASTRRCPGAMSSRCAQRGLDTKIKPGHGVYVIKVVGSPEAPHQAKDHRYYLRIAGKSRPMGHVHVQDVLRRTPSPTNSARPIWSLRFFKRHKIPADREPSFSLGFSCKSRSPLARHVGLEAIVPRPWRAQRCDNE